MEDANPRARALYQRLGYVELGRRRASWEAQAPDGTLFAYRTVFADMDRSLA